MKVGTFSFVKSLLFPYKFKPSESLPPDVLGEVLQNDVHSIWSEMGDEKAEPDPERIKMWVAARKKALLDQHLLESHYNLDSFPNSEGRTKKKAMIESLGLGEKQEIIRREIAAIRANPVRTREFCQFARKLEDSIWMERGAKGETILHRALLFKFNKLLDFLLGDGDYGVGNANGLKPFDRLHLMINAVYESHSYWGEHACHLAVVLYGDDYTMLARLIEKGADVFGPRARGTFYDKEDKIGSFYMGETVLSFAAVMGHQRIVDYLIHDVGMDPNSIDYSGNTVLHVLAWYGYNSNERGVDIPRSISQMSSEEQKESVLPDTDISVPQLEKFEMSQKDEKEDVKEKGRKIVPGHIYHQLETGIRPAKFGRSIEDKHNYGPHRVDDTQCNFDQMTPLIVAVHRSQVGMVEAILSHKSKTLWTYGSARRVRVCLSEIDTYRDLATMNHDKGALALAVKNQNVDILRLSVFTSLLDSKWKLYAHRIFHFRFYVNVLYMLVFSVALALMPNGEEYRNASIRNTDRVYGFKFPVGASSICRFVCEMILLVCNAYIFWEILFNYGLLRKQTWTGFSRNHTIIKYVNFVIFVAIVVFRLLQLDIWQSGAMTLYAMIGWLQLLYYFRGFRGLGPLSMVFTTVIQRDVVEFVYILAIVLCGFGSALWLQMAPFGSANYLGPPSQDPSAPFFNSTTLGVMYNPDDADWRNMVPGAVIWSLRLFFSQGNYDAFRQATSMNFAILIFMAFFFCVNIILLNVFIGMVNNTFNEVLGEAENEYYLAWASLIMEIDELLLAKYYAQVKKDKIYNIGRPKEEQKEIVPPVTRIGIPRLTKIYNPREKKRQEEEAESRRESEALARKSTFGGSSSSSSLFGSYSSVSSYISEKRRKQNRQRMHPPVPYTKDQREKHSYEHTEKEHKKVSSDETKVHTHEHEKATELSGYFDYDLYMEFTGLDDKPKHIVASLDESSSLSEVGRENDFKRTRVNGMYNRRAETSNTFRLK